ncbi:MAG: flagellar basal body-associated FliL family protein [Bryobacterales bacterium]
MNKKILLPLAAVLLLGAGGAGAYFYMSANGKLGGGAPAPPPPEKLGMIALDPFLTNVQGGNGRHHARISITLAIAPEERAAEVSSDTLAVARLRDCVLNLITARTAEELTSPEGKAELRKQIIAGAAPIVEPGSVKEALFGELVVQ